MKSYGPVRAAFISENYTIDSAGIPEVVRRGLYAIKTEDCTYTGVNGYGIRHVYTNEYGAAVVNISLNSAALTYNIPLNLFQYAGPVNRTYYATITFYYIE